MDIRDLSPVPATAAPSPLASPAGYPDARSWAEAEIAEWLVEADEEASAIIDRARAEALRCELAGHEELERLREEAVNVRMATAERVARRLNEARFEADQLLAEAGTQAETMVDSAREVVRGLLAGLAGLSGELPAAAGDQVAEAAERIERLLADGALAIPGRTGVLDLTGAVLLDPRPPRVSRSPGVGTDNVVMDDTEPNWTLGHTPPPTRAPAWAGPAGEGSDSAGRGSDSGASSALATVARPNPRVVDLRPAPRPAPPTEVLALPVKAGNGMRSVDDILPARGSRGVASDWWDRLARLLRRAA